MIKKYCNENYDLTKEEFPSAICTTCRIILTKIENEKANIVPKKMPDYQKIVLLKETRNKPECKCFICHAASDVTHMKYLKGRGVKKATKTIDQSNGLFVGTKVLNSDILNKSNNSEKVKNKITLCNICKSEYGPGKHYNCSINAAPGNVIQIVKNLPDKQQEQITSSLIQGKVMKFNSETYLTSKGRTSRVILNPKHSENVCFDKEKLDNFQTKTGSTCNFMRKMCNFIRTGAGKKSIPTFYRKHSFHQSKLLEDIYKSKLEYFDIKSWTLDLAWPNL